MTKIKKQDYKTTKSLEQLPMQVQKVMIETANLHNITPDKLWHKTRKDEIVDARQIAMYVIYENYGKGGDARGYSSTTIGTFFNREHATVLHSVQKAKELCDVDDNFKEKLKIINESARASARIPHISRIIEICDKLNFQNLEKTFEFCEDILELQKIEESVEKYPEIPKGAELLTMPIKQSHKAN